MGEEPAAPKAGTNDLGRLTQDVQLERDRVERHKDSWLPRIVVEQQLRLQHRNELELKQLVVAAAVALAVKQGGQVTPRTVLEAAVEAAKFPEWAEKTAPEIRRILSKGEADGTD